MSTENQINAITTKFKEVRTELAKQSFPAGAKPTSADMWNIATLLVIAEAK